MRSHLRRGRIILTSKEVSARFKFFSNKNGAHAQTWDDTQDRMKVQEGIKIALTREETMVVIKASKESHSHAVRFIRADG